ncbi:MAG: 4-alpha-glucanotransferase [Bacteroidaceae bacterium]|nr:4-alpha-glucanotransferase [Bacteroidaceae bacterium]
MKLTFRMEYRTAWGESIGVMLEGKENTPIMLGTNDGIFWEGSIEDTDAAAGVPITYRYGVFLDGQCSRRESGTMAHIFCPGKKRNCHYILNDAWKDLPEASYLYSSAFSGSYDVKKTPKAQISGNGDIVFRALCPCLHHRKQVLALCGNNAIMGNWNTERAIVMEEVQANEWMTTIPAEGLQFPLDFKFIAVNAESGKLEEWETGNNHQLYLNDLRKGEIFFTKEMEVQFASMNRKIAGTAIPVFSLRSEGSYGVGDFGDLKKFIDWAEQTHQQAVQILPINDTTITGTWIDSYPYNSISIYAFHPMYIDLRQLGKLKDKEAAAAYEEKRLELNALPQIDYEAVNNAKREYIRLMFQQTGKKVLASAAFKKFFKDNEHWLLPYAAFSHLRDLYGTPNFSQWPEHQTYDAKAIAAMCAPESECYDNIAYYYYIQYNLHIQLLEAGNYARQKGIILKGDIPIGISRNSVEAWIEPYYFNMNGQAGAPPDAFSTNGQNWGFPTYNWDVMEQDNYLWWQRRFRKMAEYFTAYRIDHILGFFRIWEIPCHSVHGLLGQFVPALPMGVEEIQNFGLTFQKDFMTKPFINEDILGRIFDEKAGFVKETFLQHSHDDIWEMRPEYDTQRKVEAWFADKKDEESVCMREGLYTLISNVLFVPDRKNPSTYHPRIAVQSDFIFERLNDQEKEAFNRLYNHYYYQRHNQFWYNEAMKKLPMLTQCTSMLVCGEDLGMVPDCVPWVMEQLQILSLEIQRMPKNPQHEFGHLWEYPRRSVCTISTHDMATLRGWWEEDKEVTARYYNHVLGNWGEVPATVPAEICEEIVRQHLYSPSLLAILSFQDWLSMDADLRYPDANAERINVPANPRHYWRYRMHLTIEDLMKNKQFNEKMTGMIDETNRF